MDACALGAVAVTMCCTHVGLCVVSTSSERDDVVGNKRTWVVPWQVVVDGFAADVACGSLGAEAGACTVPRTAAPPDHARLHLCEDVYFASVECGVNVDEDLGSVFPFDKVRYRPAGADVFRVVFDEVPVWYDVADRVVRHQVSLRAGESPLLSAQPMNARHVLDQMMTPPMPIAMPVRIFMV